MAMGRSDDFHHSRSYSAMLPSRRDSRFALARCDSARAPGRPDYPAPPGRSRANQKVIDCAQVLIDGAADSLHVASRSGRHMQRMDADGHLLAPDRKFATTCG